MAEVLESTRTQTLPRVRAEVYYPHEGREEIFYPEQRADDMGETSIHAKLINKLLAMLLQFFEQHEDVFLSSNMNLYYEEKNPNKWLAPDLLISFGVPNHERSSYQVWKEKVFPQVIFEIASNSTWKDDISEKYEIYELFGVEEYYVLDPEFAYLPASMLAFHRQGERLLAVQILENRVFSPRLGLEIVQTERGFRLFNPHTNEFLRTLEEAEKDRLENEKRARKAENELEKLKAEIERLKAQR
ncbi:MAG: Uma2 family endonuclease [Pyrinomonadaceae bacterium]